jgi:hypothetical protein
MRRTRQGRQLSPVRRGHVKPLPTRLRLNMHERVVLSRDWAGTGPHWAGQPFAGPFLRFLRGCSMIASGPGNTRLT